jgi:hypothetical protein
VDHQPDELLASKPKHQRRKPKPRNAQSGGAVYGFGLIGALVWYWRQAEDPGEHVRAVLKAVVWPAFLVYKAFAVLEALPADNQEECE